MEFRFNKQTRALLVELTSQAVGAVIGQVAINQTGTANKVQAHLNAAGEGVTGLNPVPVAAGLGVATGGSQTTLVDSARNYSTDLVKDRHLRIRLGGIDYFRKILGNTVNTLSFATLPGAAASCVIGAAEAGQVTIGVVAKGTAGNGYTANITNGADNAVAASALVGPIEGGQFRVTVDAKGAAGNSKTVIVTAGVGNNVPLSAALVENALTVTLATNGEGAVDDAANTAALVVAAIDAIEGLSAAVTVAGVVVAFTPAQAFTGGVDGTRALAAALVGSVVTVTLARDATGALVDASNTAALIAAAIDALPAFTCSSTGIAATMAATAEPAAFTGGVDVVEPAAGTPYQLLDW